MPAFIIRYSLFNSDVLSEGNVNVNVDVTKMLPEFKASMMRRKIACKWNNLFSKKL